jgi:hypothetical protein
MSSSMSCVRMPACLLVVAVAACDPIGPGAAGQVNLVAGMSYQGFSSLELRAYADDGAPFDPTAVRVTDAAMARSTMTLETPPPWAYLVGEAIGTTTRPHWRVVAWLSSAAGTDGERMPAGAPYGTTTFDIGDCGVFPPDYCNVTDNVDILLDQRVP